MPGFQYSDHQSIAISAGERLAFVDEKNCQWPDDIVHQDEANIELISHEEKHEWFPAVCLELEVSEPLLQTEHMADALVVHVENDEERDEVESEIEPAVGGRTDHLWRKGEVEEHLRADDNDLVKDEDSGDAGRLHQLPLDPLGRQVVKSKVDFDHLQTENEGEEE